MITVVTPFSRIENRDLLIRVLEGKCDWVVLQAEDEPVIDFPSWVTVKRYPVTNRTSISNRLFNEFISEECGKRENLDRQYMILNDDDSVEEGFFEKIPDATVVCVSMKRNDTPAPHLVWDSWKEKKCHWEDGIDVLIAHEDSMRVACVAGEQLIVKGHVLRNFRYGLEDSTADVPGDAKMVMQILYEYTPVYVPDAYVLFNYFEDGRFRSFRRRPIVLFVGDYHCAGVQSMGISEWETNLWKSLESTELTELATFHLDKYYYHYGKRGDEALIESVDRIKPDYIVLVMYKQFGQDPTAINLDTIEAMGKKSKIISIWGDLEAEEQVELAKQVAPHAWKMIGTASEEVVTSLGYTYAHVPKDPRTFNNPGKDRDIDVLFNGSFGHGREERTEVLQYLVDNGIELVAGGSEGADHFTTEEYADRYKRAKIAIGFSRARGRDVVNARCFEAMLCGALYMVQASDEMEKLYGYDAEYVEWANKEDLLAKVRHWLEYQAARELVARSGQRKTEELYSARTFWEKALA